MTATASHQCNLVTTLFTCQINNTSLGFFFSRRLSMETWKVLTCLLPRTSGAATHYTDVNIGFLDLTLC